MSVFKLLNSPTIIEALQKSGQYMVIPPEILSAKNQGDYLPDTVRTKITSTFKKAGKIDPNQLKMMLDNRNLDVLHGLVSHRKDLDYDTLKSIMNNPKALEASDSRRKTKRKELHIEALQQMRAAMPEFADDMIATGSNAGIKRMVALDHEANGGRGYLNGTHLFDAVTNRKDLDPTTLQTIVDHKKFDESHLAEVIKHPEPEVVIRALEKVGKEGYQNRPERISQYVDFLMRDGSPEIKKALFDAGGTVRKAIKPEHVDQAMQSPDQKIRESALDSITTPEQVKYAIANVLPDTTNTKTVVHDITAHRTLIDGPDLAGIVHHALTKDPSALDDYNLTGELNNKIPEDSIKEILKSPLMNKASFIRPQDSEETHRIALSGKPSTAVTEELFKVAKNPQMIQDVWDKHKQANPADEAQKNANNLNNASVASGLFQNPQTPTNVIWDAHNHAVAGNYLRDQHVGEIVSNPNAPHDLVDKFQDHESPTVRARVSLHPSPTPEQILKGIKDKNKDVRATWISNAADKFSDPHFAELLKDRSPKNREKIARDSRVGQTLLKQILTKDKSSEVRFAALKNPNITPDLLELAAKDVDPDVKRAVLEHPGAPASVIEQAAMGPVDFKLAKTLLGKPLSPGAIENVYNQAKQMKAAVNDFASRNLVSEFALKHPGNKLIDDIVDSGDSGMHVSLTERDDKRRLNADHLAKIYNNAEMKSNAPNNDNELRNNTDKLLSISRMVADHPAVSEGTIQQMSRSEHNAVRKMAIAGIKDPKWLETAARTSGDPSMLEAIAENRHIDGKTADGILGNRVCSRQAVTRLINNENEELMTPQRVESVYNWGANNNQDMVRSLAVQHRNASEGLLNRAMKDPDQYVVEAAGKGLSHHNPDLYNNALGGNEINLHPHVEKLKHLKGKIDEAGGVVNKNDLPNKGQGIDGKLFDGKGQLSSASIDKHIDELPKNKFNVSYGTWKGGQVHDRNASGPQKVLQLNMTNDHVKQLKDQGLWDTFKKIHSMSVRSGHPVKNHSLGWARIDESQPDHWHVDEIQSDLGQGTVRQIEKAKASNQMNPEEADTYTDHLKKMIKIFSGSFKNINHAIFGAVHQAAREKGIKSTSMDKVEDQAKQSGMSTGSSLPGHMLHTYKQLPEDHGYTEVPKKDVMPETEAPEPTVNARKLVKSLEQLKELMERLQKSDAGQYHVNLGLPPSKESTGKYAQWHLTKEQLAHVLKNWHNVGWELRSGSRPSSEGKFHSTAITRNKLSTPIEGYLKHHQPTGRVLYHGVGRDDVGAAALGADKYDPYHPDPAVQKEPKPGYDEVHSHYTLNVVDKNVGHKILSHIHGLLKDGGKAVISVRRDLAPLKAK